MHIRSLLAGVGLATAVGVGGLVVVTTASADPGSGTTASSSPSGSTCPRADVGKEVADYMKAHPDVKQELRKVQSLPEDQRAAERKAYLSAHPEVKRQLATFRVDRRGAWWESVGNDAAILQAHPDLADLFTAVGNAPAGRRQATAQAYLKQHPGVGKELRQLRQQHRQACHPGK